jgi:hypothetical protein
MIGTMPQTNSSSTPMPSGQPNGTVFVIRRLSKCRVRSTGATFIIASNRRKMLPVSASSVWQMPLRVQNRLS